MNCFFHSTKATIPTRLGREREYVCTLAELRSYHALYVPQAISRRELPKIQVRVWQVSPNHAEEIIDEPVTPDYA